MPDLRPLILLTRPRASAKAFADACRARLGAGARIEISPVLEIRHRQVPIDLTGVRGLVFTSAHAVEALARLMDPGGWQAYCVGDRTARMAADHGMRVVSAGGASADLVALVEGLKERGPLLYAHGAVTRGNVAGVLNAAGTKVHPVVVYDQVAVGLTDGAHAVLAGAAPVIAPLFSPRSSALLGAAAKNATAPIALVSLSPAVAAAWAGPKPIIDVVATAPDHASVLHSIAMVHRRLVA